MIIRKITLLLSSLAVLISVFCMVPVSPARAALSTDALHVVRYASDGTTVLGETDIDRTTMESSLPVRGDGVTHYYHQGPSFDPDDLWDTTETVNIKDKGAVKGTALKDLCDLVGGASPGESIVLKAIDGLSRTFTYEDVYNPEPGQGIMAVCWYHNGIYSPDFVEGMQLVFMTEVTNAAGQRVFGNTDMQTYLPEDQWHLYYNSSDQTLYPSSNGLSVKYISEVIVYSNQSQVSRDDVSQLIVPTFNIYDLSVEPTEVYPGEAVTVSTSVKNNKETMQTYNAVLSVNGVEEAQKSVDIAAGATEPLVFTVIKEEIGDYTVSLGGTLSATFNVIARPDISEDGILLKTAAFQSSNRQAAVICPEGIAVTTGNGTPVTAIQVVMASGLTAPTRESKIVSSAFDFGPDGAQFDHPVTIQLAYEDNYIPDGIDESDLVVGCLETGADDWEFIEDTVIDTDNNTVTFETTHFTVFAVFALEEQASAVYEYAGLTVSPLAALPGDDITVSLMVTNTGTASGSETVTLLINDTIEDEQVVELQSGESQVVTFTLRKDESGAYTVAAGGLTGTFTIGPEETTVAEPGPSGDADTGDTTPVVTSAGATTSVSVVRYASDGETILDRRRLDYIWMKDNLPVTGDGTTHYYHQGPVFEGDMWDPGETVNLKDKGPVMGTSVEYLCDLVGGMEPGNEVMLCAVDGYSITLGYENIYEYSEDQGPVVLCWYRGEDEEFSDYGYGYPANNGYSEGMQIVFMAETPNENGQYVFGNTDMLSALSDEKYQHFYDGFPSTNGLCGKWISEIRIITGETAEYIVEHQPVEVKTGSVPWLPITLGSIGVLLVAASIIMYRRKTHV